MLRGREHFYPLFAERATRIAAADPVLDLGTDFRFRKELKPFAPLFRGRYVAMGFHASRAHGARNVHVDGDIHALPFATECAGGIVCLEVLEHLPAPHLAVDEMHRVLRPGGHLLLTVPFMAPYHTDRDVPSDFFRYTHDGLTTLLRRFRQVEVHPLGGVLYRFLGMAGGALGNRVTGSRMGMAAFNALDRRLPTRSPLRWLAWAEK
jgi:SAM-dependent methyltransferase